MIIIIINNKCIISQDIDLFLGDHGCLVNANFFFFSPQCPICFASLNHHPFPETIFSGFVYDVAGFFFFIW